MSDVRFVAPDSDCPSHRKIQMNITRKIGHSVLDNVSGLATSRRPDVIGLFRGASVKRTKSSNAGRHLSINKKSVIINGHYRCTFTMSHIAWNCVLANPVSMQLMLAFIAKKRPTKTQWSDTLRKINTRKGAPHVSHTSPRRLKHQQGLRGLFKTMMSYFLIRISKNHLFSLSYIPHLRCQQWSNEG